LTKRTIITIAIAAIMSACTPEPAQTSAEIVTEMPAEIVSSTVLPSKVIAVDPPKRFGLTFRNQYGDEYGIRIAKRCSGWEGIPVGTERAIRWTTYRDARYSWTEASDDGESIRSEFCA
jgi:hypothetical protein